jgi:nucleotide-binding universal stress UspA family protein
MTNTLMENFTYFVPLDFTECSYNALHYATILARNTEGRIKICHVIDLEELPDSENPVVLSFAMDRLIKKAQQKIRSLREIISMDGVNVKDEIVIGNVRNQLIKQIDEKRPNVVVIGRDTSKRHASKGLVGFLTKNTSVPVLVVPQSHNPKIPSRAVLASDVNANHEVQFGPVFDIIKKVSKELSVVNINSSYFANAKGVLKWLENERDKGKKNGKSLTHQNGCRLSGVIDFIRINKIDLLCTVRSNSRFFDKLLHRNISRHLTSQADVPVLVITE